MCRIAKKTLRLQRFASDPLFSAFALQIYEDEILNRTTYFSTRENGRFAAGDLATHLSATQCQRYFWPSMGKLRGSDVYFGNKRTYVEALTAMIGPCTWMVTIGPKEKEWMDLAVLLIDHEYVSRNPAASMAERMTAIQAELHKINTEIDAELSELDELPGPAPVLA